VQQIAFYSTSIFFLNFMICTPLEQFAISSIIPVRFGNLDFSFTNSSLYMLCTVGLIFLLFHLVTLQGGQLVPSRWQSGVEMVYQFVSSLVDEQIGQSGKKIFSINFYSICFFTWNKPYWNGTL